MPIIVSGTFNELLLKMEVIKGVTTRRKDEGWILFQLDEEWKYETRPDERVCDICRSFAGDMNGVKIPVEFSEWKRWGKNQVKPGTHIYYDRKWSYDPDSYGGCRCNLFWYDYMFVLTNRLFKEFEDVTL